MKLASVEHGERLSRAPSLSITDPEQLYARLAELDMDNSSTDVTPSATKTNDGLDKAHQDEVLAISSTTSRSSCEEDLSEREESSSIEQTEDVGVKKLDVLEQPSVEVLLFAFILSD